VECQVGGCQCRPVRRGRPRWPLSCSPPRRGSPWGRRGSAALSVRACPRWARVRRPLAGACPASATTSTPRMRSAEDAITNGDDPGLKRAELDAMASETLQRLFDQTPGARPVPPVVGLRGLRHAARGARRRGGGRGEGRRRLANRRPARLHEHGQRRRRHVLRSRRVRGAAGDPVRDRLGLRDFVANGFDATAEAGAMVGKSAPGLGLHFVNGRAVYALTGRAGRSRPWRWARGTGRTGR
jgi:hypothetical protein